MSAEAGDVGVDAVVFFAGLHQVHAIGRNVDAGAGDDGFKLGHEGSVIFLERLELVEDGRKKGRDKDEEDQNGKRGDPRSEPVAAGPAADDPVEEQQNGRGEQQGELRAPFASSPSQLPQPCTLMS